MGSLPETVNTQDLARLIGVLPAAVRAMATEGRFVRVGRDQFPLEASVQAYCERLRETAAGRGGAEGVAALTAERARLAREQADAVSLKNAVARGEMVPAAEIESAWSDILRRVRAAVLAVPSRVRQRLPHMTASDAAAVDAEIRTALTEAASDGA